MAAVTSTHLVAENSGTWISSGEGGVGGGGRGMMEKKKKKKKPTLANDMPGMYRLGGYSELANMCVYVCIHM